MADPFDIFISWEAFQEAACTIWHDDTNDACIIITIQSAYSILHALEAKSQSVSHAQYTPGGSMEGWTKYRGIEWPLGLSGQWQWWNGHGRLSSDGITGWSLVYFRSYHVLGSNHDYVPTHHIGGSYMSIDQMILISPHPPSIQYICWLWCRHLCITPWRKVGGSGIWVITFSESHISCCHQGTTRAWK